MKPGRPARKDSEKSVRVTLFLRPSVAAALLEWAESEGIERATKAAQIVTRSVAKHQRRGDGDPRSATA